MVRLIHPQSLHPSSKSFLVDHHGAKCTTRRWLEQTAEGGMLTIVGGVEVWRMAVGMTEGCVDPDEAVGGCGR